MNKEFFKTKNARIVIWIAIIVAVALFLWLTIPGPGPKAQTNANFNNALPGSTNTNAAAKAPVKKPAPKPVSFVEKKTPHFVSATIANNATLTQAPDNLIITFDTALSKNTQATIIVKKDDITSVTLNSSTINNKTMTVSLNATVADGDYYVYYVACFADTGCSDGRFGYHLKLP